MKPAKECGMPVDGASRRKLVTTKKPQLRPAQDGEEDTEERVLAMRYGTVSLTTSSRDKLWRATLSCSLWTSRRLVS